MAQANGIGPVVATAAAPIERMSELLRTLSFDVDSVLPGVLDSQTRAMASMRTLIEVQETVRKRLVRAGHEAEGLEQLELLQMQEMSSFFGEAEQATRRERRLAQDRARRILERAEAELRELYEETGRRCREHWQLALDDARGAISAAQQVALAMTGEPLPVAIALPRPAEVIANGAGDGETGNQSAAKLRLVALPGVDENPRPVVEVATSEPAGALARASAQGSATVAPAPDDSHASRVSRSVAAPPPVTAPYSTPETVSPSSAQTATPTNAAQPTSVAPAPKPVSASDSFVAAGGNTMPVETPAEETPAEETPAEETIVRLAAALDQAPLVDVVGEPAPSVVEPARVTPEAVWTSVAVEPATASFEPMAVTPESLPTSVSAEPLHRVVEPVVLDETAPSMVEPTAIAVEPMPFRSSASVPPTAPLFVETAASATPLAVPTLESYQPPAAPFRPEPAPYEPVITQVQAPTPAAEPEPPAEPRWPTAQPDPAATVTSVELVPPVSAAPELTSPLEATQPAQVENGSDDHGTLGSELGAYELVVGPFAKFSSVNDFLRAVRKLNGVLDVRTRRFQRGMLQVRVEYENQVPLTRRLREIEAIPMTIKSASGNQIEVVVAAQAS